MGLFTKGSPTWVNFFQKILSHQNHFYTLIRPLRYFFLKVNFFDFFTKGSPTWTKGSPTWVNFFQKILSHQNHFYSLIRPLQYFFLKVNFFDFFTKGSPTWVFSPKGPPHGSTFFKNVCFNIFTPIP